MPYEVKGNCVFKKDGGAKVGCTKGSVKDYLAALHANVVDESTNKLRFIKPKFNFEWEEAIRYPEFKEMGKDGWIEITKRGYVKTYDEIKDVLSNVNLDFNSLEEPKKERFKDAFNNGKIEIPIAVKFSDSDYDLVAGNTRLAGLVKNNITNLPIWIVDISNLMESTVNEANKIKGGKADKLNIQDIADKFNVPVSQINKQLEMGKKVEHEHTKDMNKALEISMDHLSEFPDYYTRLDNMEKEAIKNTKTLEINENTKSLIKRLIREHFN
jgi:hypothetical protein